jgi:transposase
MAEGKKNAERLGAYLVFVDESGFLLIPTVRKTWAPCGHTPIVRHRQGRRQKVSAIAGLSVSPVRQRLGLYYRLHTKNIQQTEVRDFLRHLLRHLRGPLIVVWDNGSVHGGDLIRALCRTHPRLQLERFPAYAPELDPAEGVWHLSKAELANGRPDVQDELLSHVTDSLERLRHSPPHLRGCIQQSQLPFFLP